MGLGTVVTGNYSLSRYGSKAISTENNEGGFFKYPVISFVESIDLRETLKEVNMVISLLRFIYTRRIGQAQSHHPFSSYGLIEHNHIGLVANRTLRRIIFKSTLVEKVVSVSSSVFSVSSLRLSFYAFYFFFKLFCFSGLLALEALNG